MTDLTPERHTAFSNGTQFTDWEARNCMECIKSSSHADGDCDIDEALTLACCGDGKVSGEIAERMGLLDNTPPRQEGFSYTWDCPERVE